MKREYWIIIIVYIGMQLSSLVGLPVLMFSFNYFGISQNLAIPFWLLASFTIALMIVLFLLRKEMNARSFNEKASSFSQSAVWAISGIFLALFAQYAA
ncbi:MAG: CPBP family intramembrane metalloprotease, partial [Bacillus sp. (in: Bacteria)]|nr:CPBP family intramembrane metalloprotease [Bacillus sp. (in: firmicutes)]